jgi:iron(III) transport system permease protein
LHLRLSDIDRVVTPTLVALLAFGVIAPLAFLLYGALTTVPIGRPFTGFSLRNFIAVGSESVYLRAFLNTLIVGTASTLLAAIIGIALAWVVARTDAPARGALRVGVMVPFFLSPFIGALAWTLLLQRDVGPLNMLLGAMGIGQVQPYSIEMIIWVMGLYYAPYVFIFVSSALYNIDPSLEEAGHMSGLSRRQVTMQVTLPLVAPAILSGVLLTFVAAAGQFGVPALLGMQVRFYVVTTYMYQLLHRFPADYNAVAALGLVMLAIACMGVWGQNRIMRGRSYATLTGKGFRPRIVELGRLRWLAFAGVALYILVAAVLPLAMLAWVSAVPYYDATFDVSRLSAAHFNKLLFGRGLAWRAVGNTLFLAVSAAIIAILLAVVLNWVLLRSRSFYRKPLEYLLVVPAAIPHVVLGVGMLWTYIFVPLPIYGTIWILLIAYVTGFITQAVRNVGANYVQIDKSLEEAATMVGASRLRGLKEVTLPLLKPGMVGAGTLLFIVFVRELSTSIFLYSPGNEVLSVMLFNLWTEGDWGGISALAMIQVVLMAVVVFLTGVAFKVDLTKSQA